MNNFTKHKKNFAHKELSVLKGVKGRKEKRKKRLMKIAAEQTVPRVKAATTDVAKDLVSLIEDSILTNIQVEAPKPALDAMLKLRKYFDQKLSNWNHHKKSTMAQVQPEGTRFVRVGDTHTAFVIEQKPTLRTLNFDDRLLSRLEAWNSESKAGGDYVKRQVSLPYVIFVVVMQNEGATYQSGNLRTYFRNKPLVALQDDLCSSILPNMSTNVCMGPGWGSSYGSPCQVVEEMLSHYWGAGFTMDYLTAWNWMAAEDKRFLNARTWSEATEADPDFAINVKWQRHMSLQQALVESVPALADSTSHCDVEFIAHTIKAFEEEISKLIKSAGKISPILLQKIIAKAEAKLLPVLVK